MEPFKLDNNPKIETGFSTPENYFENFSDNLMLQLTKKETKVIPLFSKKKIISVSVAAAIAFLFMIPIINNYNKPFENLDSKTLETYLSYQSNINQYDLISGLDINDIKVPNENNIPLDNSELEKILSSSSNIEQFLLGY